MPTVTEVRDSRTRDDALAVLRRAPYTAWDSETAPIVPSNDPKIQKARALDPFQNRIVVIQATDGENSYLFFPSCGLQGLKWFLESTDFLKILQNGKFDLKQWLHHLGIKARRIWDTMIAEKVITAGLGKGFSLDAIAWNRLHIKLDKTIAKTFGVNTETGESTEENEDLSDEQAQYALQDVHVLLPIYRQQLDEIVGLENVIELEMLLTPILAGMEETGFLIDQPKWRQLIQEFTVEEQQAALNFYKTAMPDNIQGFMGSWDKFSPLFHVDDLFLGMNPGSHDQLTVLFNYRLGNDGYEKIKQRKNKWGKPYTEAGPILPGTGQKDLAKFRAKCREKDLKVPPYIDALKAYRQWQKMLQSFGVRLLEQISEDGALHPYLNQIIDSGRMSCRSPNLQQMPKRDKKAQQIRGCFIARPGYVIIKADYSQIELRILAEKADERLMIDAFLRGEDLHKRTVSIMKGIPIEQVTDTDRTIYKAIGFGIPYGLTEVGLSYRLDVPRQVAAKLYNEYMGKFTSLKEWLDAEHYIGLRDRISYTDLGRYRHLGYSTKADDDGDEITEKIELDDYQIGRVERIAANHKIQGTAAEMLKMALIWCEQGLSERGWGHVLLPVHDELVCEVREEVAHEAQAFVEETMNRAGAYFLKVVPCAVESKIGKSWG